MRSPTVALALTSTIHIQKQMTVKNTLLSCLLIHFFTIQPDFL